MRKAFVFASLLALAGCTQPVENTEENAASSEAVMEASSAAMEVSSAAMEASSAEAMDANQ